MPTIEDIPLECYNELLDTEALVQLSRTSSVLHERSMEPWVWALSASRDFGLDRREALRAGAHPARILASMGVSGACHHALVRRGVAARAAAFWRRLAACCAAAGLPLAVLPPPTGAELAAAEAATGVRFPFALRTLLAAVGGEAQRGTEALLGGAMGGVVVYDYFSSLSLLAGGLSNLVALQRRVCVGAHATLFPVATSLWTLYLIECGEGPNRGTLFCGRLARTAQGQLRVAQLLPAAAGAAAATPGALGAGEGAHEDDLLAWCEAWVALLEGGGRATAAVPPDVRGQLAAAAEEEAAAAAAAAGEDAAPPPVVPLRYISAWPMGGTGTSHAVTRGVHLFASSLLLPALSKPGVMVFAVRVCVPDQRRAAETRHSFNPSHPFPAPT